MEQKCKRCHSYAINPHQHGRTPGVNEHLCDVCYWRDQYEGADLRHGVAVARIAELEAQLAEAREDSARLKDAIFQALSTNTLTGIIKQLRAAIDAARREGE